ncbi:hypothetical protein AQJ30_15530 [Streptomyces longwoodensis]|uniref:Uncharacterized protein n=1 Tax=Streptomyces longwoodensis TaxID=68231 RepID=A0A117QN89_9ACTN|nr:hypothetical protein [Streptomyces longwoodensis]KUN37694.1 hypothetical protein AQJ30_15530 [Streptomyces longwoodensis]
MTISLLPAAAAPGVEVHGGTFIGHDVNGWTVAMICAIVAAVIYETTMALLRKVPLRIPFVVLQLARIQVPKAYRSELYQSWRAELWPMLKGPKRGRLLRWIDGMKFAIGLSLRGARATTKIMAAAKAAAEARDDTEAPVTPVWIVSLSPRSLAVFSATCTTGLGVAAGAGTPVWLLVVTSGAFILTLATGIASLMLRRQRSRK